MKRPLIKLQVLLFVILPFAFVIQAAEPPATPILRIEAGMHIAMISGMTTDSGGHIVLTCSIDKTARLWSVPDPKSTIPDQSSELLRTFRIPIGEGAEGKLHACALAPDGTMVALGGHTGNWDGASINIYLFDTTSGRLLRHIEGLPDIIEDISFSRSGRYFAAALANMGGVRVFDAFTGREVGRDTIYSDDCKGLDWYKDEALVTTCRDGVRLYKTGFSDLLRRSDGSVGKSHALTPSHFHHTTLKEGEQPYCARFSPDGSKLAVGFHYSTAVTVLSGKDLSFGFAPDTTGIKNGGLGVIAWSTDGNTLAAGGMWRNDAGTVPIRLWSEAGRGNHQDLSLTQNTIISLRSFGERGFLWGGADPAWGVIGSLQSGQAISKTLGAPPTADHRNNRRGVGLSADATVVAFQYRESPASFTLEQRQLRLDLASKYQSGVRGPQEALPTLLAARTNTLPIKDWNNSSVGPKLNDRLLKRDSNEISRCLAVAPDTSFFLLGTSLALRCFANDGAERWKVSGPATAYCVNISADGRIAVAAYGDGTIRWYQTRDGRELLAFFPHADRKRWVLWTPGGYYDCSAYGEELIGWHVNRGKDRAADFFPADKFRDQFYRPDIIDELIRTWDIDKAVKLANAARGKANAPVANLREIIATMAPPVVELTVGGPTRTVELPEDAAETTLSYRVRGGSTPVSQMRVLVDSRPVEVKAPVPGDEKAEVKVTVPLPDRDCVVAVLAGNRHAFSEPAIVNIRRKVASRPASTDVPQKGTLYVLAVGVSKLKNQTTLNDLETLEYADDDATAFSAALAGQKKLYRAIESRVLTDDKATAGDILDALDWLKSTTKPEDTTLILLAGHGESDTQGRYTFCAHDYDRSRRLRTGVGFEDIKLALGATKGEVVLFLDACSAGSSLGEGSRVNVTGLVNQLSDSDSNIVVFASSDGRTASLESDDLKQGLFTYCVKEGLGGKADLLKNGRITLSALQTYVDDAVRKLSNGQQIPVINIPKMVPNLTLGLKP